MSDYVMSRESLKQHCERMCTRYRGAPASGTYGEHRLVLDLLEQTEWIPCSERLPEEGREVLCQTSGGIMLVASYGILNPWVKEKGWITSEFNRFSKETIMAWMLLPGPYTEELQIKEKVRQ